MPANDTRPDPGDPRNDRIYLGILTSLMATVIAGAVIAIAGDMVWHSPAARQGGFYISLVAGVFYFVFRFWGRVRGARYQREKVRRELAQDPPAEDADDGRDSGG